MTEPMIAIHIPQQLYWRLQRLSGLAHRPLENLVLQTLESNIPALPDNLPLDVQDDLTKLETLNSDELWQVAKSVVSADHQTQYSNLLQKNKQGDLTEREQQRLDELYQETNHLTLRKSYAYVLLKWRGHQLPSLTELEAAS